MLKDRLRLFEAVGFLDMEGVPSDARRPGLIPVVSGDDVLSTFPSASATSSKGLGDRLGLSLVGARAWSFGIYRVSRIFSAHKIEKKQYIHFVA